MHIKIYTVSITKTNFNQNIFTADLLLMGIVLYIILNYLMFVLIEAI